MSWQNPFSPKYITSRFGTGSWTNRTLPFTTMTSFNSYKWAVSNSTYTFICDSSFNFYRSSDLINWTPITRPASQVTETGLRVATVNDALVITFVPTSSLPYDTASMYSLDNGDTWEHMPFDNNSLVLSLGNPTNGPQVVSASTGEFLNVFGMPVGHKKMKVTL